MSETDQNRSNAVVDTTVLVMFLKVVIVIVFVYPLVHYTILNRGQDANTTNEQEVNNSLFTINELVEDVHQVIQVKKKILVQQPSCPLSYLQVILQDLCKELFIQHEQCTPEDFHNLEKHKLPKPTARNNTTGEPRGTIVGCVAAGLLLTSLGAAFVELYKAKSQTPVKAKPPMSRKCSLADLTVLKHNRKELVRRESIMEIPETGAIKPLGFRPPPLYRRCSFPVGPSEITCGSTYSTPRESRRTSIESRQLSIIDSRRSSRQASLDESPERRHWSRLVHRH